MPNTQLMALNSEYLRISCVICTCQHDRDIRGNAFLVVHVAATFFLPSPLAFASVI